MSEEKTRMSRRTFLLGTAAVTAAAPLYSRPSHAAADEPVEKVHVIFKTHLDLGFTDLEANVVRTYLDRFIPAALDLAEELRREGAPHRFKWTTGAWLIARYLEAKEGADRRRMEEAIGAGDICWHALPFTFHSELLDASLFTLATKISASLDRRFGVRAIAAKMTDVPGHTCGIVPPLAKAGVELLHVGVNPASSPPDVPEVFVWEAPDGSRVSVMYQKDYGGIVRIPQTREAVAIIFTGDNQGPQSASQVLEAYARLKEQFPEAELVASDLNAVAARVSTVADRLPVLRKELGDSWIHGAGSDPKRIAQLRALSRLRKNWIRSGALEEGGEVDLALGTPLMMIAEHTWGLDIKTHLQAWDTYTPEALRAARATPPFQRVEASWQEKRDHIQEALRPLPEGLGKEADRVLAGLCPVPPELGRFEKSKEPAAPVETTYFTLALDPLTGALRQFQDRRSGRDWASADHPLALFAYQTFSQADYDRFMDQYLTCRPDWALKDFGKPGIETLGAKSRLYPPRLKAAWVRQDDEAHRLLAELEVPGENGDAVAGCPRRMTVEYSMPRAEPVLQITLQWFDKPANRLPEALWLSFIPRVTPEGRWTMDKMGQEIDPRNVVKNGGHRLHAVTEGIRYSDAQGGLRLQTLDAPLVAPAQRTLLNFDNQPPAVDEGMHFCLFNNVWGTNFAMWFDQDMRFRFSLRA